MFVSRRFAVIERGAKLLYLNTSIRGYPRGLRAGLDARKPLLDINEHFDALRFQGAPYNISSIEVQYTTLCTLRTPDSTLLHTVTSLKM